MNRISTTIIAAALALLPLASSAHMAAGQDIEVDGYILDFGFAPELPVAGQLSDISINLVDAETEEPVDTDEAWVRIGGADGFVFSGRFRPVDGNVTFSIVIPEAGDQEVHVQFLQQGEVLLDRDVTLPVVAPGETVPSSQQTPASAVAVVSAAFGAVLMWLMLTRRRPRKSA